MRDVLSRRRRALLIVFLMIMFGALAIGYMVTFQLDTVRRVVQQQMLDVFGQNLQVGDIQVAFFPSPTLTLTNLQIKDPERGEAIFQAEIIQMDLGFLAFLRDEFAPKGLKIKDPQIYLRRNEEGEWNFKTIGNDQGSDSSGVVGLLNDYTLNIENGVFHLVDAFENAQPESVEFENVMLHISNLSPRKSMDVLFSAQLNHDESSQMAFQGMISDAQDIFSMLSGEVTSQGPKIQAQTQMDLNHSDLLKLSKFFNISDLPLLKQGRMKAQSQIQYGPGIEGYELVLNDFEWLSHSIDLHGKVTVARLQTNVSPTVSATWSSPPIRIQNIIEFLPSDLVSEIFFNAMEDFKPDGKIEVVSATVTSPSKEDSGLRLTGEFKLSDGRVNLGNSLGVAESIQGRVIVQPNQIQIHDFNGQYDSIPISSGTGVIEFRETGPWLTGELNGTVQSKKLLEIVRSIFGWTDSRHEMAGLIGVNGKGKMKISFAGPLDNPEEISLKHARYDAEQVTLRVPTVQEPLTNVSGTVTFSTQHVSFEPLRGLLGTSPIAVQGKINFQDDPVYEKLKVTGQMAYKDWPSQSGKLSASIKEMMSGVVNIIATISGPVDAPRIQNRWDLQDLTMNVNNVFKKAKGVPGVFDIDFEMKPRQRLQIYKMTLALPSLSLSGEGSFSSNMTGPLSASITASPIDLSALPTGLTLFDNALKKGILEYSLKIDGRGSDWRLWHKDGWIKLTQGALAVEGLNSPLSDVFFQVKFARHLAEVKRLQFNMQENQARIVGAIQNWETTPNVKFEMLSPQFDIDLLIPKGERSPVRVAMESIAATNTVDGKIIFRKALYKDLKFQDLHAGLKIKNGIIGVDRIEGKTESGTLKGRLLIHLPVEQPATVKTWVKMTDIPLQPLETTFLSAENLSDHLVTGTISVQGAVQGHGKDNRGIIPTLNGDLQVLIKDGRIQKGTVIPKMLAIMNLPSLLQGKVDLNKDGYPFDSQSSTISIKNGVMRSDDIRMDGPILKITGAGTYDMFQDKLDLAIAASPLGPYFKLLRKISLFRLLLEGDQESIDMAIFDVKGSFHDPEITPLPLESFKTGLTGFAKLSFNILKNTITLPKTILFPKDDLDSNLTPNEKPADE